jgi:hypothetical protein
MKSPGRLGFWYSDLTDKTHFTNKCFVRNVRGTRTLTNPFFFLLNNEVANKFSYRIKHLPVSVTNDCFVRNVRGTWTLTKPFFLSNNEVANKFSYTIKHLLASGREYTCAVCFTEYLHACSSHNECRRTKSNNKRFLSVRCGQNDFLDTNIVTWSMEFYTQQYEILRPSPLSENTAILTATVLWHAVG